MSRTKKPTAPTCDWRLMGDADYYETSCGGAFIVNEGTPAENGMKFCAYCGNRLKSLPPEGQ